MAITAADILFKFTIKSASQGDTTTQSSPTDPTIGSLGGYMSSNQLTDASLNNLFDNISGAENAAGTVDYRAVAVHNSNTSLTWQNVTVWIQTDAAGGASMNIGLDPTAVTVHNSSPIQAVTIATETAVPAGVTFPVTPPDSVTPLSIGNIAANSCKIIWIRRTATNSAAVNGDSVVLRLSGDTAA